MGGDKTPAIGFAIGLERLILIAGKKLEKGRDVDIYIVNKGQLAETLAIVLSRMLSDFDLITELDMSGSSFSRQFKKANKCNAKSVVVIGDDEAKKKEFIIKLFNNSNKRNNELKISIEDNAKLEEWIVKNLNLNISEKK